MSLDSKIPSGPMAEKWTRHKRDSKLINPKNKRKYSVIVVGSGLAGSAAAASLAELGYKVKCFCFQDSARRAHSIAAQGGINAAKNYQNDGDSVHRLFYDTVKGGDFRPAKPTSIVWQRSVSTSSTSALHRASHLRGNTVGVSPTARLVARRSAARFTLVVRLGSSCSSARILR